MPESGAAEPVSRMVERIVGCKWSLAVLACVRNGTCRPGAIERAVPGMSTKVMNQRLSRMLRFGILERTVHAEVPPHVEYRLTEFGSRFIAILDEVEALQRELDAGRSEP